MTWDVFQGSHVLERKSPNTVPHSGDTVNHMALGLVMLCCVAKMKGLCTGRVLELTLVDLELIKRERNLSGPNRNR